MNARPGWYPDPSGRFPKRWYDGSDWTASVLDHNAQQSYDLLPPAGAPAVAGLPPAVRSVPRPPPSAATPPPPPPSNVGAWQPAQPWQPTETQSAEPYTPTTSGGVWAQQQPVTTASLGLTPPPVRTSSRAGTTPLVYGLVGGAVACMALSMFVLDWYSGSGESVGFRDFGDLTILSSAPFLDKLAIWNFNWLGYVIAGLALLSTFAFVIARAASHHIGHVLAAIVATIGAAVSTLAIVRLFRTDEVNPDFGAWLLPAGYLVLLLAIVVSARNERA